MARYCTASFWTKGQPATGLTPTIRIRDVSTGELIVTDETMFEVGDGGYAYLFTAFDPTKYYQVRCDAGSEIVNQYSIGWSFPDSDDNVTTIAGKIIGTLLAGNHNPQGGDSFARIGANGAGLTAIGDSRLEYLDASILSRLATAGYTSPDNATITAIAGYLDTEIAAILEDTGTTIPGLIAALNNLSSAQAQSAAAAALAAYDPPTKAELDSAVSPLATASALDAVDNFVDTEVAAIKAVTDKIDGMLELDSTVYRFTDNALENSPGGFTATDRTHLETILTDGATLLKQNSILDILAALSITTDAILIDTDILQENLVPDTSINDRAKTEEDVITVYRIKTSGKRYRIEDL